MALDPEHTEMQETLDEAAEMQLELGDKATGEQVENWLKRYRFRLKVQGAAASVQVQITRHARTTYVGIYQSCMFSGWRPGRSGGSGESRGGDQARVGRT